MRLSYSVAYPFKQVHAQTNLQMQQDCTWPNGDPLMQAYHDHEWGRPLHNDRKLFEFMVLDAFQAGLSWRTVLHKRATLQKAFCDFEIEKVASFTEEKVEALMQDAGIIRNRVKIKAAITNAQRFMEVQQEFGSFHKYIWQFTGGKTIDGRRKNTQYIPVRSNESDAMSKALSARGFKFVGTIICYAFMQATGMINDHVVGCFLRREIK